MKNSGGRFSKLKLTLGTTVVAFIAAIAICQVFKWFGFPEQQQVNDVRSWAGWTWTFAAIVAWILIATPIIEETIFRFPTRFVKHPAFAVALSALFSFCHYIDLASIKAGYGFALLPISNAFVALFLLGITWCWLYRRTGSIWCSMLSHSIFNTVNLALALIVPAN